MIDDIIKKMLALPKLEFSPEMSTEFHLITNYLTHTGKALTIENFKMVWSQNPNHCITEKEMKSIEAYFVAWQEMVIEMEKFNALVYAGWQTCYGKPIGGDEFLAFVTNLLPTDEPNFSRLLQALMYAREVNQFEYHINAFSTAAEFLQDNKSFELSEEDEKCRRVIRDLRVPDGLIMLQLSRNISQIFVGRMVEISTEIFNDLKLHQIPDYDFDSKDIEQSKLLQIMNQKILAMYGAIGQTPFSEHPRIEQNIKKYIAYHEYTESLNRKKSNDVFDRLRELVYKFPVHENVLGDDLDKINATINDVMQTYLCIPDERRTSIINLLWAKPNSITMPLRKLLYFLAAKIHDIELASETAPSETLVTHAATPA